MKIFAYGSNMCVNRLKKRVKSAKVDQITFLSGHVIRFHKKSKDGSGKANAFFTNNSNDKLWGVLYDINENEKQELDKAEGLGNGYDEKDIHVVDSQGRIISAQIYIASETFIDEKLKPFDWYKAFVLNGAKENRLPNYYIKQIEHFESITDTDNERNMKNRWILEK